MIGSRRIYYLNHDYPRPSGGIRVIYRQVELLRQRGFEATVVQRLRGYRPSWFTSEAPVECLDDIRPLAADFVVIPENYRNGARLFGGTAPAKIVFCQNHHYVFRGFAANRTWRRWCSDVVCVSTPIRDYLRRAFGINDAPLWPCFVDRNLFRPRPKRLQICYMPRKRPEEAKFIRESFAAMYPGLRSIPWVRIDGLPEREVARIMGESAIFLALGRHEGLGLPPLEAMASACQVVGFSAGGGAEYASPENGRWVDEGDLVSCVDALAQTLKEYEHGTVLPAVEKTLSTYSRERADQALVEYWAERMETAPVN